MRAISITLFAFFLFSQKASAAETLVLSIGRWGEWKVPNSASVSVSNGSIVRVTDLGAKVKITAKKLGLAELRAGDKRLSVFVVREPVRRLYESLKEKLNDKRGLEVVMDPDDQKGSRIRVTGRLLRREDWKALGQAASGSNASFEFEAAVPDEIAVEAENYFRSLLRASFLPELALKVRPYAEVTVATDRPEIKKRVQRVLGPFGFKLSVDPSALGLEPLVRVRLIVAEFRKNLMRKLGVQWPGSYEARLLPEFQAVGEAAVLPFDLHALEDRGFGKVLASPTLLCRSGKEAEFLAGGEIPIRTGGRKTQDVVWKKYGILLKIRPKADHSGRMSIGIITEVSMVDTANAVEGIPGFLTNRIESHFDLASSRTIVLSGLIKKEWGEMAQGLPGLSNLPVLGALFSSRGYRDNQTELVVFVTPELARIDEG